MHETLGRGRRAGIAGRSLAPALLPALAAAVGLAAGCGAGGGSAPKKPESALLYAQTFSLPNYSGILQDEDLTFQFSAPVKLESINPDSIQIRTGTLGGIAPFGTYVRGEFLVDTQPGSSGIGNRIVIDPAGASENLIKRVEHDGYPVPDSIRVDLGNDQPNAPGQNGQRRVLFDKRRKSTVTFVPEVPTRAALDDAGFAPASTYTISLPGYPSTNTLENESGAQLISPNGRIFTSSFTTVPATSPQRFLGSESAGRPRLIHSQPYNGTAGDVDSVIYLRFSQPLDPRTVNQLTIKVELASVSPTINIPISVFLAQQRLGKCEVVVSPINPLPANGIIRVSMASTIEDLRGQAMNTTSISFSTGGIPPAVPPMNETFVDGLNEDIANTTANWNDSKPYVGGVSGGLTASFAPYAGDGSDGAFSATAGENTVIDTGSTIQRIYNYTTFSIPIGANVIVQGSHPLVIHCQGAVDIAGSIVLDGFAGSIGLQGDSIPGPARGGAGGLPGPGGNAGGDGAFKVTGAAGNIDGINGFGAGGGKGGFSGEQDGTYPAGGFWPRTTYLGGLQTCAYNPGPPSTNNPCRSHEGGGGGGFGAAGGDSGLKGATLLVRDGATLPNGGAGGVTSGNATFAAPTGSSTSATVEVYDPVSLGMETVVLSGIPTLIQGMTGSGGGGGGGEDDTTGNATFGNLGVCDGSDEGGGGGGGSAGGLQITSFTTINVSGTISAKGGDGGGSYTDTTATAFSQGAGGGGGSGGAVWLQSRGATTFQVGSVVNVAGGAGGRGRNDGSNVVWTAGVGGSGRIRLEDSDGSIANAPAAASLGTFAPVLDLVSEAYCAWQNTGIFTPNFSAPEIDAEILPTAGSGTIKVYLEGAQEDTGTIPDDPDVTGSTGPILVWDSEQGGLLTGNPWDVLDNNKWYRFRVVFTVDASHTFTDPMPIVRSIIVNVSN